MLSTRPHHFSRHTSPAGILFSDLDGTLFRSDDTLSPKDRTALEGLGRQGIIRVIATGRSLHSFRAVAGADFPADYVIFSTGAGVASLHPFDILKTTRLKRPEILQTVRILREARIDFMLHRPIPDNHAFAFETHGSSNPDFQTRLSRYRAWAEPLDTLRDWAEATQFVAILPPWRDLKIMDEIKKELAHLSIIRATSPFDHRSTWMEIFPEQVSKGTTAAWLCERLGISPGKSMAVGNDYNDLEILELCADSYVVANAPEDLTRRFSTVASNNDNGVTQAITHWLARHAPHIDAAAR